MALYFGCAEDGIYPIRLKQSSVAGFTCFLWKAQTGKREAITCRKEQQSGLRKLQQDRATRHAAGVGAMAGTWVGIRWVAAPGGSEVDQVRQHRPNRVHYSARGRGVPKIATRINWSWFGCSGMWGGMRWELTRCCRHEWSTANPRRKQYIPKSASN